MKKRTENLLVGAAVAGLFAGLAACGQQPAGKPDGVNSTPLKPAAAAPAPATTEAAAPGTEVAAPASDVNV